MNFIVRGIAKKAVDRLFEKSDAELQELSIKRLQADYEPGFPCRLSLRDAKVGETVLLLNYQHLDGPTPYKASHGIYIIEGEQPNPQTANQLPRFLNHRTISLRGFDAHHYLTEAMICPGEDLRQYIASMLKNSSNHFIHVHNAVTGCYLCSIDRL